MNADEFVKVHGKIVIFGDGPEGPVYTAEDGYTLWPNGEVSPPPEGWQRPSAPEPPQS